MTLTTYTLGGLILGTPYENMKFATLGRQVYTLTVLTNDGTNITYQLVDDEGNVYGPLDAYVDTQVFQVNVELWPNPNI